MRKYQLIIVVVLAASLILAACQSSTPTPEATAVPTTAAVEPTQASQPVQSGQPTECTVLTSLLPQVPPDQIPPVPLASENDWVLGSLDAEFSVIEYTDFQCPYCAQAAPELERFQATYSDRVNLVIRHFPLISIHDKALPAAYAAEAAGAQGKFFEMHDLLYANQSTWSSPDMSVADFEAWARDQAESLGLDMAQYDEDVSSQAVKDKLDAAYKEATETIGLSGTPSVFIILNGIPYQGPRDYDSLEGILNLMELDKDRYQECPPMVIDQSKQYTATIETTKGDIVVELYADKAPVTVNSFVFLARDGYFNDVPFHRVMPGFVAQAGDPSGSGYGGPGYEFINEITDLTFDSEGVLGMANAGADTNGSQFFITYAAQPNLDGGYTVFGKVIEGLDVLNNLTPRDPQQGLLNEPDRIISVTINEK